MEFPTHLHDSADSESGWCSVCGMRLDSKKFNEHLLLFHATTSEEINEITSRIFKREQPGLPPGCSLGENSILDRY